MPNKIHNIEDYVPAPDEVEVLTGRAEVEMYERYGKRHYRRNPNPEVTQMIDNSTIVSLRNQMREIGFGMLARLIAVHFYSPIEEVKEDKVFQFPVDSGPSLIKLTDYVFLTFIVHILDPIFRGAKGETIPDLQPGDIPDTYVRGVINGVVPKKRLRAYDQAAFEKKLKSAGKNYQKYGSGPNFVNQEISSALSPCYSMRALERFTIFEPEPEIPKKLLSGDDPSKPERSERAYSSKSWDPQDSAK